MRLTRDGLVEWLNRPAPPRKPEGFDMEPWCARCNTTGYVMIPASDFGFVMVVCGGCANASQEADVCPGTIIDPDGHP